jgi:hypothetical protein
VLPPKNKTKAAFAAGENIGMSASSSVIALGAPTATAGSACESGEVFVATETKTGTWKRTATDAEPNPVSDDDLGGGDQSVSVAGNGTAIVAGTRAANGQTGQVIAQPCPQSVTPRHNTSTHRHNLAHAGKVCPCGRLAGPRGGWAAQENSPP